MAIIFVRTVILYFAILISMRIMGKRQLGEMEISEFIVAALIADLAATPLQDIGIPLLNGLVPIIIMFCFEIIIAGLNMRSVKLRKLTYGRPEIIIRNGRIIREAMQKTVLLLTSSCRSFVLRGSRTLHRWNMPSLKQTVSSASYSSPAISPSRHRRWVSSATT